MFLSCCSKNFYVNNRISGLIEKLLKTFKLIPILFMELVFFLPAIYQ